MAESKIDKVLTQLRTDFEAYSLNQNNVIKAAEAKEAIEVIEGLRKGLPDELFDLFEPAFMTMESSNGKGAVKFQFATLKQAQALHSYFCFAQRQSALSQQVEANHE